MHKSSEKSISTSTPTLPDTVDSHVELAKNRFIRKIHKRPAEKVTETYPSSAQMTLGSGAPPGELMNLMFFVCRQVSTTTKDILRVLNLQSLESNVLRARRQHRIHLATRSSPSARCSLRPQELV